MGLTQQIRGTNPPMLAVNLILGLSVLTIWVLFVGPRYFSLLSNNWPVAVTMVFGSLVGGGTSEGGGAVGFPVLTKVLDIPADTARLFTFAIQSVGMTCASLSILISRVPLEKRVLGWGGVPAILGCITSLIFISPHVPLPVVRVTFTMILTALGIALLVQVLQRGYNRNIRIATWGQTERRVVVSVGFGGGILSGIAGVGENTVMFILLVLFFRVCEKVTTPTTVVLMTMVSIPAFAFNVLTDKFVGPVVDYWLVAAPVVAIGAPLGAWICTKMSPLAVRATLIFLIAVELTSTVIIVPFTPNLVMLSLVILGAATATCVLLVRSTRYVVTRPPERSPTRNV